tara:strand:+ start:1569 stop:3947 length:2379 start_codon:yes stop_codon:yes gene_type:complete
MEEIKIVDKANTIKIDKPNEKKILKKLEKTDEWEKIKVIKDIYNEIEDYGIEKEDIGLNCAKYLNKVGETGKFEVEELYNTCYKLKALRNKRKKKEKKEKAPKKGKAGKSPVDKKVKEDKDIDKAKSKSVEDMITKALASATDAEGNVDYNKLFTGVSKLFCSAGIKSGLNGIYNSLIKNWDKINQVGWTSSGWEFGKELMTEVFKIASSCSAEIYIAVGGISSIIAYFTGLYGKIVRLVRREGDPPTDDDDEDPDAGGEDSGLPNAGGLSQTTPQAGLLTYSATDVEGERVSNLQNSFTQLLQQQKSQDNRQKQSQQNTLIENEIKSTPAYSNKKSTPDTKPTSRTTEENIIRGEELTPPRPIRKKPDTDNEGITKTQAGLGLMGLLTGAGALFYGRPQPLAPTPRGELFEDVENFFDTQEELTPPRPKDIPKKMKWSGLADYERDRQKELDRLKERMNQELDEKERIGKGLATAMVMGGQGGKLAQATLSPLVLYLRGTAENPTLKLQSVQSQTEQQKNPEQEALMTKMNEDMDIINSLIDQSNQDIKPTQAQYDLREKQQQLMRDINTNTTPVEEEFVEEPDINEFINETEREGDINVNVNDFLTNEIIPDALSRVENKETENERIRQLLRDKQFEVSRNEILRLRETQQNENDIEEEISRENQRQKTKQADTLREYSLSNQGAFMGEQPDMSLQIEEEDTTSNAEEQSLQPRPRGRPRGATSSDWRAGLREFTGRPLQNDFTFRQLTSLGNPIITEFVNEIIRNRPTGSTTSKLNVAQGKALSLLLKK